MKLILSMHNDTTSGFSWMYHGYNSSSHHSSWHSSMGTLKQIIVLLNVLIDGCGVQCRSCWCCFQWWRWWNGDILRSTNGTLITYHQPLGNTGAVIFMRTQWHVARVGNNITNLECFETYCATWCVDMILNYFICALRFGVCSGPPRFRWIGNACVASIFMCLYIFYYIMRLHVELYFFRGKWLQM